jgi:chemotaxis protein MotB
VAVLHDTGSEHQSGDLEFTLEGPKKNKKKEADGPKDLGPILFAALAIIMLAFFILLNALSTIDTKRRVKVLGSLQGTFGVLRGSMSIRGTKGISQGGIRLRQKQFVASLSMFEDFVQAKGFSEEVSIDGTNQGFTVSISSSSLFDPGEVKLKPKTYQLLDMLKFIIAEGQEKFHVRIEGHSDDTPTKNERYPSNWDLSVARALAVLRYMQRDSGIDKSNLEAAGYAQYRPKVPNNSPANRARNRRVEFAFFVKEVPKILDPEKSVDIGGFKFVF